MAIKSSDFPCRGPVLDSQHPHIGGSQLSVVPVLGVLMPSVGLHGHCTQGDAQTHMQTPMHIKKQFLNNLPNEHNPPNTHIDIPSAPLHLFFHLTVENVIEKVILLHQVTRQALYVVGYRRCDTTVTNTLLSLCTQSSRQQMALSTCLPCRLNGTDASTASNVRPWLSWRRGGGRSHALGAGHICGRSCMPEHMWGGRRKACGAGALLPSCGAWE